MEALNIFSFPTHWKLLSVEKEVNSKLQVYTTHRDTPIYMLREFDEQKFVVSMLHDRYFLFGIDSPS